jgi:hypothetical protein
MKINSYHLLVIIIMAFRSISVGQVHGDTLPVVQSGIVSDGGLIPVVANPSRLTGHRYSVTFDSASSHDSLHWVLTDVTLMQVLHRSQFATNDTALMVLNIDGLELNLVPPPIGMKVGDILSNPDSRWEWGWDVPSGTRRWTWVGANQVGYPLEGFNKAMGYWRIMRNGKETSWPHLDNLLVKLAAIDTNGVLLDANDTTASFAYRYLDHASQPPAHPEFAPFIKNAAAGYAFQAYEKTLPLAAYDMESTPPRRLAVGILENNVAKGLVNGRYWPPLMGTDNMSDSSAREWLWILDSPYTGSTPNTVLQTDVFGNPQVPIMWWIIADRRSSGNWSQEDQFAIYAYHPFRVGSVFNFTAPTAVTSTGGHERQGQPRGYCLEQNYPNPFNPSTTIRYGLPARSHVSLTVFNTLGQKVAQLVNEELESGYHEVQFNASSLSSGVYFYRLQAGTFVETKRLLLLR